MKTIKKITMLFCIVVFLSCKNDKKTTEIKEIDVPVKVNTFEVVFDLVATQNDNFHLYYTEDGSINFTEEQSLWYPYTGSNSVQEVKFSLPEGIYPTNLRVDFGYGANPNQKQIALKKFRVTYSDKSFEVKDSAIFNYFYPNVSNTVLDKANAILTRQDGNQETAPSIYPHTSLSDELTKMIK